MATTIRNLWDSALVRGLVVLAALGAAPVVLLSMATEALGK